MPLVSLFYDLQNKCLVRGFNNSIQTGFPNSFQGDTLSLFMRFMNPTGNATVPYVDADESAAFVQAAIGTIGGVPTSGTFTITDPDAPQTTAPIAFNASASTVQSAIQAGLTTNWSMATVAGNVGGPWTVTNGANAVRSRLTIQGAALVPKSQGDVEIQVAGDGSNPAIQYIRLLLSPIAYQDSWTPYPAPSITVANVQTGGVGSPPSNSIQSITLNNQPYNGTFTITFGGQTTAPLSYNAAPSQVQIALQTLSSIGNGNCTVGGSLGAFQVTFIGSLGGAAQAPFTTSAAGLVGPLALTGNFSLATVGIEEAIGDSGSIQQTFEVKITPSGGQPQTVLQTPAIIANDLIPNAPAIPTPTTVYLLAGNNLGDVLSASTSRTNLGLGTAAVANTGTTSGTIPLLTSGGILPISTSNIIPGAGITITPGGGVLTIASSAAASPSLIKNAAYTALAYDQIEVDTSGGAVTITFPAAPAVGVRILFGDATGSFAVNNLTIARNSLLINGSASDYVASVTGIKLTATYISTGYGWSVK